MSQWSYVRGLITVEPMGRTQPEKRYILDTVLDHLPRVTGSEEDMSVYVIQKNGYNSSCSCDELGQHTNNLIGFYGARSNRGMLRTQDLYILAVDGSLRDRTFHETMRSFMNWICRLAKRVCVRGVLVSIESDDGATIITDDDFGKFWEMFEPPSWFPDNEPHEPTWCEYLMWQPAKDSSLPVELLYKYYDDSENDEEFCRRNGF